MRAPRQTLPGIALVTIAALLSACGVRAAAIDPAALSAGIRGRVKIGPTCPVQRVGQPCVHARVRRTPTPSNGPDSTDGAPPPARGPLLHPPTSASHPPHRDTVSALRSFGRRSTAVTARGNPDTSRRPANTTLPSTPASASSTSTNSVSAAAHHYGRCAGHQPDQRTDAHASYRTSTPVRARIACPLARDAPPHRHDNRQAA